MKKKIYAIDLFCGIGGLTNGLIESGIDVLAGFDIDATCKYAYETNNDSTFYDTDISKLSGDYLLELFPENSIKVLVGCAPCQPFSNHTLKIKNRNKDSKWGLLYEFSRLIEEVNPEIVSMENVAQIKKEQVFQDFIDLLKRNNYKIFKKIIRTADYGVPQSRRRMVVLASKNENIEMIKPSYNKENYITVKKTIGKMEPIDDGETSKKDILHRSSKLKEKNKLRIQKSKPGGTWRDWPKELIANCHNKVEGKTYPSVYGRMKWDKVAPTITTQFYNFGTGRFGHPEQDRGLSLREGAMLQTFSPEYKFIDPEKKISFGKLGIHIGNAVPVKLGYAIGKSILKHVGEYNDES
jgi:DNA (cytosine-5)-methyltransferase 1